MIANFSQWYWELRSSLSCYSAPATRGPLGRGWMWFATLSTGSIFYQPERLKEGRGAEVALIFSTHIQLVGQAARKTGNCLSRGGTCPSKTSLIREKVEKRRVWRRKKTLIFSILVQRLLWGWNEMSGHMLNTYTCNTYLAIIILFKWEKYYFLIKMIYVSYKIFKQYKRTLKSKGWLSELTTANTMPSSDNLWSAFFSPNM